MVSLVNSHKNATSKRWHLWEVDVRFALNSTPGWTSKGKYTLVLVDYLEEAVQARDALQVNLDHVRALLQRRKLRTRGDPPVTLAASDRERCNRGMQAQHEDAGAEQKPASGATTPDGRHLASGSRWARRISQVEECFARARALFVERGCGHAGPLEIVLGAIDAAFQSN